VLSGDYNVGPCPTAKHHGLNLISPPHSEPAKMELETEPINTPSLTNKVIQIFFVLSLSQLLLGLHLKWVTLMKR
jgi:hypothetical protein